MAQLTAAGAGADRGPAGGAIAPTARGAITGSKLAITLSAMIAALMAVLDISITNVAISDIRASFGTPLDQIAWVSTGYLMANVVVIPLTGWLQRRFGYRRYFVASVLVFTLASELCGLAWNLPALVIFRVLQGVGGGAIIPTAQSILFARYPKKQHGLANALFALGALSGPLFGPSLGGYLIEVANWRWIFLINLPLGLVAALLGWRSIKEPGFTPSREPIDLPGLGLLVVGLVSLQYVLEEGNREGWWESATITALAIVAAVALVTFVVHELETPHPVVQLRVFANRNYAAGSLLNFMVGVVLFSGSFLFALFCGVVMRYRALEIGLLFARTTWIQLIVLPLVGTVGTKVDGRYLMAIGIAVVGVAMWVNGHLTATVDGAALAQPLMLRAIAMGMVFVPLNVIALSDLPTSERGNAAGLFSLTRELGGSIGTAWITATIDRQLFAHSAALGERLQRYNPMFQQQFVGIQRLAVGRVRDPSGAALVLFKLRLGLQVMVQAFNDNFLLLGGLFVTTIFLVLVMKRAAPDAAAEPMH